MVKRQPTAAEYIAGIRAGNRTILSRAITLAESTRADHKQLAEEIDKIVEQLGAKAGKKAAEEEGVAIDATN